MLYHITYHQIKPRVGSKPRLFMALPVRLDYFGPFIHYLQLSEFLPSHARIIGVGDG